MDTINEVISNLKFIGMVKKNEKINTKFMFIQKDNILTRLSRTFINPDNRYNTLIFLQKTISNAFQIINHYDNSNKLSDEQTVQNLIKDLLNARLGLINIQETYHDDLKFRCDIRTLIETIQNKMKDLSVNTKIDYDDDTEYKDYKENDVET